jgi:hypothetical protein
VNPRESNSFALRFQVRARRIRSALLLAALSGIVTCWSAANRFAAPGKERPNFLFFLSHDQTYRALGLLGELEVKTPNLDRLARRGIVFTHCFNQGGWSGAVCVPSRMMLNTGRTLWRCRGTNDQEVAADAALWGETLGKAGYDTFMAGKWHIPDSALERSFKSIGPLTGGFLPSTTNGGAAYYRPVPGNPWRADDSQRKDHWLEVDGRPVRSSFRIAEAGYHKVCKCRRELDRGVGVQHAGGSLHDSSHTVPPPGNLEIAQPGPNGNRPGVISLLCGSIPPT